jgi:hypothetical protein
MGEVDGMLRNRASWVHGRNRNDIGLTAQTGIWGTTMQTASDFHRIRRTRQLTSLLLAGAACLMLNVIPPAATVAQDNRFARVCAEHEVNAITSLEDHAAANDVPADQLSAAGTTMLEARMTCYAGKVNEALALYERVIFLQNRVAHKP